jgi:hypothetical protein
LPRVAFVVKHSGVEKSLERDQHDSLANISEYKDPTYRNI